MGMLLLFATTLGRAGTLRLWEEGDRPAIEAGDVAPIAQVEFDTGRWLGEEMDLVEVVEGKARSCAGGRICMLGGRRSFCFEFARTGSGERVSGSISWL